LADSIPQSFKATLDKYSQQGFRVIALAAKDLTMKKFKVQRAKRDDLEQDARFIGLIVFQNKVKSVSADVIEELQEAKIKSVMVTGDNILTSIAVSFECGILKKSEKVIIGELSKEKVVWREVNTSTSYESFPLAKLEAENEGSSFQVGMTGDVFDWLVLNRPTLLESILVKARVFARMSPENKALLVDYFEQMEYVACFCGDGANDCGALKRASVGISLSELEASVAAPFTAKCGDVR
jgi:cation-transporting ATPase 13A2